MGLTLYTDFFIIYRHSVRTAQETIYIPPTEIDRVILFTKTIAGYCENHTKDTNTVVRAECRVLV
jgi:hypothetical protein